jgi:hypothetical protein
MLAGGAALAAAYAPSAASAYGSASSAFALREPWEPPLTALQQHGSEGGADLFLGEVALPAGGFALDDDDDLAEVGGDGAEGGPGLLGGDDGEGEVLALLLE